MDAINSKVGLMTHIQTCLSSDQTTFYMSNTLMLTAFFNLEI